MAVWKPFTAVKYVNEPIAGVALPIGVPLILAKLAVPALNAPDMVAVNAVKLPTLTFAQPELLMEPAVVPVSVVINASNAASDSFHTNAALTAPYGAKLDKLRLTKIPIS